MQASDPSSANVAMRVKPPPVTCATSFGSFTNASAPVGPRRLDELGADDAEAAVGASADPPAHLPRVVPAEAEPAGAAAGVVPAEGAEAAELRVVEDAAATPVVDDHRPVCRDEPRDVAGADGQPGSRRAAGAHRPCARVVRDDDRARALLDADPLRGRGGRSACERHDEEEEHGRPQQLVLTLGPVAPSAYPPTVRFLWPPWRQ